MTHESSSTGEKGGFEPRIVAFIREETTAFRRWKRSGSDWMETTGFSRWSFICNWCTSVFFFVALLFPASARKEKNWENKKRALAAMRAHPRFARTTGCGR